MKNKSELNFDSKSITVLIIDDHPQIRKAILRILQPFEFGTVLECATGSEAIKALQAMVIDFVICDLYLLDVTGFDVLEHIRNRDVNADIPVIVVTGEASKEEIVKASDLGANDYLLKPFKVEDLQAKTKNILNTYFSPSESIRLIRIAERQFIGKNYKESLGSVEQILSKDPTSLAARHLKALILSKVGSIDQSLSIHQENIEINPSFYRSYAAMAELYLSKKKTNEAIDCMLHELELNPKQPKRQTQLANMLLEIGKIDSAITHFRVALKENVRYLGALFGMGVAYAGTKNLDKAIYYFKRVRRYYPTNTKSLESIVKYCLEAKDPKRAEFVLKDERHANKMRLDTYVVLARFYVATESPEKAIATIEELLALKPDHVGGLKLKAAILLRRDDVTSAMTIYGRVLELEDDFELRVTMSDLHGRLGDYHSALVHLNAAVAKSPANATLLLPRIANCLHRSGDFLKSYFVIARIEKSSILTQSLKNLKEDCLQRLKISRTQQKQIA